MRGAHEAGLCGHAGGRGEFFQVRTVVELGVCLHNRHSHSSGAGGMSVRILVLLYSINTGSRDAGWHGGCSKHSTHRDRDASWQEDRRGRSLSRTSEDVIFTNIVESEKGLPDTVMVSAYLGAFEPLGSA